MPHHKEHARFRYIGTPRLLPHLSPRSFWICFAIVALAIALFVSIYFLRSDERKQTYHASRRIRLATKCCSSLHARSKAKDNLLLQFDRDEMDLESLVIYNNTSGVVRSGTVKSSDLSASWVWKAPSGRNYDETLSSELLGGTSQPVLRTEDSNVHLTDEHSAGSEMEHKDQEKPYRQKKWDRRHVTLKLMPNQIIMAEVKPSALYQARKMGHTLCLPKDRLYDCNTVARKLRAMVQCTEMNVNALKRKSTFFIQLAAKAAPKKMHCLPILITTQYLNFSDPTISRTFNPKACGWAFGMNIFDLKEWKHRDITVIYHHWQNMNDDRPLWKLGTLPPGLISFYNLMYPLDRSWHVLGIGYDMALNTTGIKNAAVIH